MVTALVETTVIVDILRNHPPAVTWLQSQQQPSLGITPIIWMEVIGGGPTKVKQIQAARLMKRFDMIHLTPDDLNWAMQQQMTYELSHDARYDGLSDCIRVLSLTKRITSIFNSSAAA